MSMQARQDDAKFGMSTPLCQICKNSHRIEFDPQNPDGPLTRCEYYNDGVPDALAWCRSYDCEFYIPNPERIKVYADVMGERYEAWIKSKQAK